MPNLSQSLLPSCVLRNQYPGAKPERDVRLCLPASLAGYRPILATPPPIYLHHHPYLPCTYGGSNYWRILCPDHYHSAPFVKGYHSPPNSMGLQPRYPHRSHRSSLLPNQGPLQTPMGMGCFPHRHHKYLSPGQAGVLSQQKLWSTVLKLPLPITPLEAIKNLLAAPAPWPH